MDAWILSRRQRSPFEEHYETRSTLMNRSHTHFERLARMASFLTPCLVSEALFSCVCAPGCGRRAKRREARRLARLERQNQNVEQQPRPETNPTLTPEGLFREMIYVYANAKYYSDSGYVEFLCEMEPTRQTRSYRIPCSVSIASKLSARQRAQADSERRSDDVPEILGETYKTRNSRRRAAGRRVDQRALSGRKFCGIG